MKKTLLAITMLYLGAVIAFAQVTIASYRGTQVEPQGGGDLCNGFLELAIEPGLAPYTVLHRTIPGYSEQRQVDNPETQFIDGFEALFGTQVENIAQAGLTFDGTLVYGRFKNIYGDVLTDDHVKALFKLADHVPASLLTDVRIQLDNNPELKARLLESDFFLKFRKLENSIPDLTDLEKSDLLKDLVDNPGEFLDYMEDLTGEKVRAWEKITGHPQLRIDVDVLESLSKALDDDYLKSLNLELVITNKWTQHGFGCPTCTSGGKPWINELIDQLDHFKQFKDVEGYQTVLDQLLNQGKTQTIGSHWVMKFTKQRNLSPTKFEDFVDEVTGDFSADIIANGKFIECKSWGSKAPGMSNVPNQMINYFNTQTSLSGFEFQFDPQRWVPSPADLNQALKANSNLFNTVDDAVWNKYVAMVQSNVNDIPYGDVDALVDRITSSTIFSQIINP